MPPMMPPRPPGAAVPPPNMPGAGGPPAMGALPPPPEAPAIPSAQDRTASVSDADLQLIKAAPDTVEAIARLFPEIADELMAIAQTAEQDDQGNEGDTQGPGPSYSLPRPTSRLGQV